MHVPALPARGQYRINRNIMECKETHHNIYYHFGFRINRNIMECKDICVWVFLPPGFCINRNIMECKEEPNRAEVIRQFWY